MSLPPSLWSSTSAWKRLPSHTSQVVATPAIIASGLIHPLNANAQLPGHSLVPTKGLATVGVLLILKAFSAGCSALTGVEAIANGVPVFREPKVTRARQTEVLLGVILGVMLLGLAVLARRWHVGPRSGQTVLSQIMILSVGKNWAYYVVALTITIVLALAAIVVIAVGLRWYQIGRLSFWYDEVVTMRLARAGSPGALIERLNFALALTEQKVSDVRFNPQTILGGADLDNPDAVLDRSVSALLQDHVSDSTKKVLQQTAVPDAGQNNTVNASKLVALIIGSPEFQRK